MRAARPRWASRSGLGEVAEADVTDDAIAKRFDLFSSVASTSAGGELKNCEVLLFGNSPARRGDLPHRPRGACATRSTPTACARRSKSAGLSFSGNPTREDASRIVAVFAKAEASPTGAIRGRRNTMLSDADINYERHARAALGAVIASRSRAIRRSSSRAAPSISARPARRRSPRSCAHDPVGADGDGARRGVRGEDILAARCAGVRSGAHRGGQSAHQRHRDARYRRRAGGRGCQYGALA